MISSPRDIEVLSFAWWTQLTNYGECAKTTKVTKATWHAGDLSLRCVPVCISISLFECSRWPCVVRHSLFFSLLRGDITRWHRCQLIFDSQGLIVTFKDHSIAHPSIRCTCPVVFSWGDSQCHEKHSTKKKSKHAMSHFYLDGKTRKEKFLQIFLFSFVGSPKNVSSNLRCYRKKALAIDWGEQPLTSGLHFLMTSNWSFPVVIEIQWTWRRNLLL